VLDDALKDRVHRIGKVPVDRRLTVRLLREEQVPFRIGHALDVVRHVAHTT
jgi:hypothetical protein